VAGQIKTFQILDPWLCGRCHSSAGPIVWPIAGSFEASDTDIAQRLSVVNAYLKPL
jgi:hypothetical protein